MNGELLRFREIAVRLNRHFLPWFLLAILLSTALRPAYKYIGSLWIWVAYAAFCVLLLLFLKRSLRFTQTITSRWFVLALSVIFAGISAVFYPMADGLKASLQGQDQDDCTILVSQQLLRLDFPYDQTSYFGNPCSPLFGALLPYIPFVALGVFLIANGFILLVFALTALRLTKGSAVVSLSILISLGIPQTLELMVNGSDLVFMGFGLLFLSILMVKSNEHPKFLLAATILAALLASSRVSLPILGAAFLIWLFVRHRGRFLRHFGILLGVGLLPSLLLFASNPDEFSPLHLVAKGQRIVPGFSYVLMILATIAGFVIAFRRLKLDPDPFVFLALTTSPHLLFLSFGDLIARQWDFFWWEGASYLLVVTPLFSYLFSRYWLSKT